MKQIELNLFRGCWGGRRPNSGRRRKKSQGVSHSVREKVQDRTPLHINFKFKTRIRNKDSLRTLKRAIKNAGSHGLRVIHYSMQSNHIHLIIESANNEILTRGMRSLTITFAKGLKKGSIQIERYHLHVLKSLRETKNAVHYVLFNEQKHANLKTAYIDEYSSLGLVADLKKISKESGFSIVLRRIRELPVLFEPKSWLLNRAGV